MKTLIKTQYIVAVISAIIAITIITNLSLNADNIGATAKSQLVNILIGCAVVNIILYAVGRYFKKHII